MVANIDFESDLGKRALNRLRNEQVIWLTTVNFRGQPQSSPVWFLWRESGFDIYSQADATKLRSIADHPEVSLNLNTTETGEEVVTFEGTAQILSQDSPGTDDPEYLAKYTRLIQGWMPDEFAKSFSARIRVHPTRMRTY